MENIDLISVVKKVYSKRKTILLISTVAAVLTALFSLSIPNQYSSTVTFIPQLSSDIRTPNSLSRVATLVGVNLGGSESGPYGIPPTLYPQLIQSTPFKEAFLSAPLSEDQTVEEYLVETALGWKYKLKASRLGLWRVTNQQEEQKLELFEIVKERVSLLLNDKEGFITLTVTDQNPLYAARMTTISQELLQDQIIKHKNTSAIKLLEFTESQLKMKRKEMEVVEDEIARFKDQNLSVAKARYRNELFRLQNEISIIASVVRYLSGELEQKKLQVKKDTPVFTIINPVTISEQKTGPSRGKLTILMTFAAAIVASGLFVIIDPLVQIKNRIIL